MASPPSLRRQGVPGCERIHVVPPMRDLPVFDPDDRAEPIVVLHAGREDRPMDLVFDDDDTAVIRLVGDQSIGGPERDVVDIAPERGHQVGPPLDDARPAGHVVEHLVDGLVGEGVKEVLAVDEVANRPSDEIEVRGGRRVGSVFRIWHLALTAAGKVAYEMRATYKWEACFEEEGTFRSVTYVKVSHGKAEPDQTVGPCGNLQELGSDGDSGVADKGR